MLISINENPTTTLVVRPETPTVVEAVAAAVVAKEVVAKEVAEE